MGLQEEATVSIDWLHTTLDEYGTWVKDAREEIYLNGLFLGHEGFFLLCKRGGVLARINQVMTRTEEPLSLEGGTFSVSSDRAAGVISSLLPVISDALEE